MNREAPRWLAVAPAVFLTLWSGGFTVAKLGLHYAAPLSFLAVRYILVVALLALLYLVLRPPLPRSAAAWGHLAAVGLLMQALYFTLSYLAFSRGESAGTVALIVSLQPVLVAVLAPYLAGERVSMRRWIGLLLGLLGAAMVIAARAEVQALSGTGLLFAFGALLAITAATLYEKRFGVAHHPVVSNLVQFSVGLAVVLPLAWGLEGLQVHWSATFGFALGYLALGNSLVAITLLLAMIRHGEAARVSSLFFLVPPYAALIAWPVLGEAMPPLAWAGMALAAAGVALAMRRRGAALL